MPVYLLHFDKKLNGDCGNKQAMAQHYCGYTSGAIAKRIERHRQGNGARIMQAVVRAGITFRLARSWKNGDRQLERELKKSKNLKRHCPICAIGEND